MFFAYWENKKRKKKPLLIEVCHNIMKKKNPDFIIITNNNLHKYINISSIPENIINMNNITFKTNYLRYKILYEHGGLYIDSDMIVIDKDIYKKMINLLNSDKELVIYNDFNNAFFAAKKKSEILYKVIYEMEIIANNYSVGELDNNNFFTTTLIRSIIINNNLKDRCVLPPHKATFYIGWKNSLNYVKNTVNIKNKYLDKMKEVSVVTLYRQVYNFIENSEKYNCIDDILNDNILLSDILNYAIKI